MKARGFLKYFVRNFSLPKKKMLAPSTDGPNTNRSVLEKLNAHRDKNELSQILESGSCGLMGP